MAIDEALLRFFDPSGNVRDLQITAGFDGGYRLSINDKRASSATHAEALAVPIGATVTLYSLVVSQNKMISGFWFSGETNDPQEVSVYVYMLSGIPQYQVSDFSFESIEDFKDKANMTLDGNTCRFTYPYMEYGVFISLRSSLNERIEAYMSDDNELSLPALTTDKSIICMVIKEYNEF